MKSKALKSYTVLSALALALSACGGGDDDQAGGPVEFNAVPAQFGYTADAGGACAMGSAGDRFLINGGTGPYTAEATSPGIVSLYTNDPNVRAETITNISRGGYVRIFFEGGCTTEEGVTILIKDARNNQFTVTVTNTTEDS